MDANDNDDTNLSVIRIHCGIFGLSTKKMHDNDGLLIDIPRYGRSILNN